MVKRAAENSGGGDADRMTLRELIMAFTDWLLGGAAVLFSGDILGLTLGQAFLFTVIGAILLGVAMLILTILISLVRQLIGLDPRD